MKNFPVHLELLRLLNFLVIWSELNCSVQSCLQDNSTCHENGKLGNCCSDFCFRLATQSTGCCRKRGNFSCVSTNRNRNTNTNTQGETQQDSQNGILIGFGVGIFIAILMLALGLFLLWKKRLTAQEVKRLTADEVEDFWNGKKGYQNEPSQDESGTLGVETALALPFDRRYELTREELKIDKSAILGQGQFGVVLRGQLRNRTVAVKTTKPNTDIGHLKALLSELKIMAYIDKHENIIEFLGTFAEHLQDNVIYVVVEFCPLGDLLSFMKKNRENFVGGHENFGSGVGSVESPFYENTERKLRLTTTNFLNWCTQIANGMAHLERKRVVHADLAARNILMFHNDVVKISDFGLSRQILNYSNYTKKSKSPVPWRWLSLESLRYMEFTSKSDIWSYAVLLWEIFTLGQIPFPNYVWDQNFVNFLTSGHRLDKPEHATDEIYGKMLECWDKNPERRSNFQDLHHFFNQHYRNQFYVQLS